MFLFQSKRPRGGQFISFERINRSATCKGTTSKAQWQRASSKGVVPQHDADITATEMTASTNSDSTRRRNSSRVVLGSDICANHVLVNAERERVSDFLPLLNRSGELDRLAQRHAQAMAANSKVSQINADELVSSLQITPQRRLGVNVMRGSNLGYIHYKMVNKKSSYHNMIDWRYVEMGMSSARGEDGKLYVCQIFRG